MEVRCPGCSRKYIIPDDRLADRLAYLTCDSCGARVVVRSRGAGDDGASSLKGAVLSAGNIVDGLRFSFNLKNCIVSFLSLLAIGLLLFCCAVVASFIPSLLTEMPVLRAVLAVIIGLSCVFIIDLNLYLVSKNTMHRLATGSDIRFGDAMDAVLDDLKAVGLLSVGLPAACIVLAVPLLVIGEGRLLYAGVIYPVIAVCFTALVLVQLFKNILLAFIASRSRSVAGNFSDMLKFLVRENINIPLYMALVNVLTGVFFSFLLVIPVSGILIAAGMAYGSALPGLFAGGPSFPGPAGGLQLDAQAGLILISFFSGIILLICGAYCISLWQTLSSVAVTIMESNPGRSIHRTAVLGWVILAAVLAWGIVAGILIFAGIARLLT